MNVVLALAFQQELEKIADATADSWFGQYRSHWRGAAESSRPGAKRFNKALDMLWSGKEVQTPGIGGKLGKLPFIGGPSTVRVGGIGGGIQAGGEGVGRALRTPARMLVGVPAKAVWQGTKAVTKGVARTAGTVIRKQPLGAAMTGYFAYAGAGHGASALRRGTAQARTATKRYMGQVRRPT
jgi:hypothetical protein